MDDWLMVVAGVFYTTSLFLEIFLWLAYREFDLTAYVKVPHLLPSIKRKVCFRAKFHALHSNLAHKTISLVFHEAIDIRQVDESICVPYFGHTNSGVHCSARL